MLFKLLAAPMTMPLAGFRFILNQVSDMAVKEAFNEDNLRDELLLLQVQVEDGTISQEEFAVRERDVIARLRVIREAKLNAGRR
jgi:hypothetical protein